MRVRITITAGPWTGNTVWGKTTAKWEIIKGAVTILTIGVNFSIKI